MDIVNRAPLLHGIYRSFVGLQGASGAVRGAAFLCRLAQAEQKHPVGILTNFPGLRDELYLGWPVLERVGDVLTYQGPLPRDCPCALPHRPMIGSSGDIFYSSSAFPFTFFYFWVRILRAIHLGSGPSSLRVGGCAAASSGPSPTGSSLPVCTSSWSLQEATESVFPLFAAWSSSSLSRNMLRSHADAGWVDRFLSCTPTGPADSSRSALLERCSLWALGPSSASSLQPSVPSCLGSTASSTLTARTRSRSRSRSKRPLASLRQRVDVDDGNVARLPVTRTPESASAPRRGEFNGVTSPLHLSTGCLLTVPLSLFPVGFLTFALALPRGALGFPGRYWGRRSILHLWYYRYVSIWMWSSGFCSAITILAVGQGSGGLGRSTFCNDFKVAVYGRQEAINRFAYKLSTDAELRGRLWTLSGLRLLCHCTAGQACHGDVIISEFAAQFPGSYDRKDPESGPPSSQVLNLSRLREEPESEGRSSADEGCPDEGRWLVWRG